MSNKVREASARTSHIKAGLVVNLKLATGYGVHKDSAPRRGPCEPGRVMSLERMIDFQYASRKTSGSLILDNYTRFGLGMRNPKRRASHSVDMGSGR